MALTRIEFNSSGFRDLLTSAEMRGEIAGRIESIRDAAGDGFGSRIFVGAYGGGRWVGVVYTETIEAMIEESRNNTLERALGSAG